MKFTDRWRVARNRARRLRANVRRFARLRPPDVRDFLLAESALLATHWQMWRRPAGRLITPHAADAAAHRVRSSAPPQRIEQLRVAVARAARFGVTRPSCLTRALALMRLLEREGFTGAAVRIGVRRVAGTFEAHAWVDYGGVTLDIDPALSRPFIPLTDVSRAEAGDAS